MKALIERIKLLDQMSYVTECLAADYTGEARRELSEAIDMLHKAQFLTEQDRATLLDYFLAAKEALVSSDGRRAASSFNPACRYLWRKNNETLP